MSYQRRYLQQTQVKTFVPTTPTTTREDKLIRRNSTVSGAYSASILNRGTPERALSGGSRVTIIPEKGWTYYGSGNDVRAYKDVGNAPSVTYGTSVRVRRGEMTGGDLRLSMAQGKRSLRIEPTELGQLPGRDLPPPGADSYDPFSASEAESLAGLRRRRGPQIDLAINASNAATGLNTL